MRLTAYYSKMLQKKRGNSGVLQTKLDYKNKKISTRKLYTCRESKILVLVRATHSELQIQYCAEINEFLPKVS
jgi:hypothetical protein